MSAFDTRIDFCGLIRLRRDDDVEAYVLIRIGMANFGDPVSNSDNLLWVTCAAVALARRPRRGASGGEHVPTPKSAGGGKKSRPTTSELRSTATSYRARERCCLTRRPSLEFFHSRHGAHRLHHRPRDR